MRTVLINAECALDTDFFSAIAELICCCRGVTAKEIAATAPTFAVGDQPARIALRIECAGVSAGRLGGWLRRWGREAVSVGDKACRADGVFIFPDGLPRDEWDGSPFDGETWLRACGE